MIFERIEKHPTILRKATGTVASAGDGLYCYKYPNNKMRNYYLSFNEDVRIVQFTLENANIIDLTSNEELNRLIPFIQEEMKETAKSFTYFKMVRVTKTNYQFQCYDLEKYINTYYPDCDGYITRHSNPSNMEDGRVPKSKQIIIRDNGLSKIKIIKETKVNV